MRSRISGYGSLTLVSAVMTLQCDSLGSEESTPHRTSEARPRSPVTETKSEFPKACTEAGVDQSHPEHPWFLVALKEPETYVYSGLSYQVPSNERKQRPHSDVAEITDGVYAFVVLDREGRVSYTTIENGAEGVARITKVLGCWGAFSSPSASMDAIEPIKIWVQLRLGRLTFVRTSTQLSTAGDVVSRIYQRVSYIAPSPDPRCSEDTPGKISAVDAADEIFFWGHKRRFSTIALWKSRRAQTIDFARKGFGQTTHWSISSGCWEDVSSASKHSHERLEQFVIHSRGADRVFVRQENQLTGTEDGSTRTYKLAKSTESAHN